MITIHSNGSKWAGESPDTYDELLEVLATHSLDPRFEKYGDFHHEEDGKYHLFGNFWTLSHVFRIEADSKSELQAAIDLIEKNKRTKEYKAARKEHLAAELKNLVALYARHMPKYAAEIQAKGDLKGWR